MRRSIPFVCAGVLFSGALAGCSPSNEAANPAEPAASSPAAAAKPAEVPTPDELVVLTPETTQPEDFQRTYVEPLSKKYPKTKFTQLAVKAGSLTELVSSGVQFDLVEQGINSRQYQH
jgi:hypothetical protein